MKKKKMSLTKIRNGSRNITTHIRNIKNIIREYYEKLYVNELDNLDEMDKLLKRHKVTKITQEEIENLNRSKSVKRLRW